ncbi:hypothetical protein PoB_000456400 [Plakobranchus ocellatus]|uniref:Uncharacterized protein n=1 Tax=Plakobranchus ocellatus TaxID=259542 RepID=A0AAV3Y525_9GAST|nr:hypothetical protein PoB_000456400 [Plakobranchus ocellatus]
MHKTQKLLKTHKDNETNRELARHNYKERDSSKVCSDCLCIASTPKGNLRLSDPPSGQGTGGGAQTCNRRITFDLTLPAVSLTPSAKRERMGEGERVVFVIVACPLQLEGFSVPTRAEEQSTNTVD